MRSLAGHCESCCCWEMVLMPRCFIGPLGNGPYAAVFHWAITAAPYQNASGALDLTALGGGTNHNSGSLSLEAIWMKCKFALMLSTATKQLAKLYDDSCYPTTGCQLLTSDKQRLHTLRSPGMFSEISLASKHDPHTHLEKQCRGVSGDAYHSFLPSICKEKGSYPQRNTLIDRSRH